MTIYELIQQLTKFDANCEVTCRDRQIIVYEPRTISVSDANALQTLKEELEQEL